MSQFFENNLLPGLEAEKIKGIRRKSILLAGLISPSLFGLLPLSEFIMEALCLLRDADIPYVSPPPPPPPTQLEKVIQESKKNALKNPQLNKPVVALDANPMDINLDVSPGDFKSSFSLASFNPAPSDLGNEFVFSLHELDRNPSILKRGRLSYPPRLKRRGLEGEVKLLVQIDEQGKVQVIEVVSSTHPDFIEPSKLAAESSVYEAPMRNGEPVRTQFYLPIRFTLLDN